MANNTLCGIRRVYILLGTCIHVECTHHNSCQSTVAGQGLFQDFASEGANAKFQNSRGGKYKAKEGHPHIKRTEKPIPRGGKSTPWLPPEINPGRCLISIIYYNIHPLTA